MFVPTIAGSDGTVVSVATGQNEYHLLFLSVGNVHNQVQRAQQGALVLIGFLAIVMDMVIFRTIFFELLVFFTFTLLIIHFAY